MAYNKVDLAFSMTDDTAERFYNLTRTMNFSNEQALAYLLDLYDRVKPQRDSFPKKYRARSHLHTCVQPEIKEKFRQLAREYGLSYNQLLTVLIDTHDQCPGSLSSQKEQCACVKTDAGCCDGDDTDVASTDSDAAETETGACTGGDAMAQMEAALDMIRDAFRRVASENREVASLREQLARSQTETRKAKEAYQKKLQVVAMQLQDLV